MVVPIARITEALLSKPKTLAGVPGWIDTARDGWFRWGGSLEIEGQSCGVKLCVEANPSELEKPFKILLNYGTCIWRAEFVERTSHQNKMPVPEGCPEGVIYGPHYHSFFDNRHLATNNKLPTLLKYGRPLPPQIRGIDNALRWFCDETNILITFEVPEYPKPGLLL